MTEGKYIKFRNPMGTLYIKHYNNLSSKIAVTEIHTGFQPILCIDARGSIIRRWEFTQFFNSGIPRRRRHITH